MPPFGFNRSRTALRALNLLSQRRLTIPQLNQLQSFLIVRGELGKPIYAGHLTAHLAIADYPRARTLLNQIPHTPVSIWNTVIRSLCENHQPENLVLLSKDMVKRGCFPDNHTFSFVFRACSEISDAILALMFHSLVVKLGWEGYDYVVNGLIHCYISCCDSMDFARKVFDESSVRDVVAWTSLINGYLKIGQIEFARKTFDEMPEKNAVSWSAMINGYTQMGMFVEALETFNGMLVVGVRPNQSGLLGALSACAHLGSLDQGRWIHAYIDRSPIELDGVLGTALVDMYVKCGCIDVACHLFEKIPCRERYPYSYNSLIMGLANHGESAAALKLFRRMEEDGVRPSEVTFISVLTACSRIGLVEEGLRIFASMKAIYGILPEPKHYSCLVDLLGRAGLLEQADEVVKRMPVEPSVSVLGALLNACQVHGDTILGRTMADELSECDPDHSGVHVLLSNIYASLDKWNEVESVRSGMVKKRVKKVAGCSCIEEKGEEGCGV